MLDWVSFSCWALWPGFYPPACQSVSGLPLDDGHSRRTATSHSFPRRADGRLRVHKSPLICPRLHHTPRRREQSRPMDAWPILGDFCPAAFPLTLCPASLTQFVETRPPILSLYIYVPLQLVIILQGLPWSLKSGHVRRILKEWLRVK